MPYDCRRRRRGSHLELEGLQLPLFTELPGRVLLGNWAPSIGYPRKPDFRH